MSKALKNSSGKAIKLSNGKAHSGAEGDSCCCVGAKNCWIQWGYEYCCPESEGICRRLFVRGVVCDKPSPSYESNWHRQVGTGSKCVWYYDQKLTDTCTVDGDCPSVTSDDLDIDLPDITKCCCGGGCVYTFLTTYDGASFSDVTQGTSGCKDLDLLGPTNQWVMYLKDGDICYYRYVMPSNICCDSDDQCQTWPDPPDAPLAPVNCCDFDPCLLRITAEGNDPICRNDFGGVGVASILADGPLDGSWLIGPAREGTFYEPNPGAAGFTGDDCAVPASAVSGGDHVFVRVIGGIPSIYQLDTNDPSTLMEIFIIGTQLTPGEDFFNSLAIGATEIISYSGNCCGYPTSIVMKTAFFENNSYFAGGQITVSTIGCPNACPDITAVLSGFTGTCPDCGDYNTSVDLIGGCGWSGNTPLTTRLGIEQIAPSGGPSYYRYLFQVQGTCGNFFWTVNSEEPCPPKTGWVFDAADSDTGCGTPTLTLVY